MILIKEVFRMAEERTCPSCGGTAIPIDSLGTSYKCLDCGYSYAI